MQKTKKTFYIDILILLVFLGSFYSINLGSRPLSNPDEGRYSSIAHAMLVTGNFVTPKLSSTTFLQKPPMYYWLQASAIKVFGYNSWALRFWPAVISILGCLLTYVTTRIIVNRRTGLIAATILSTSLLYVGASHYADMDAEVAVFITISLFLFLLGVHYLKHAFNRWFFWGAYAFAAISFLTKGLMGIVFPMIIIGLWILACKKWRIILQMRLLTGLALFLVLIVPWLYLAQQQNPHFLYIFFIQQQFQRFTSTGFNNPQPIWFYLAIIFSGFGAWIVLLVPALKLVVRDIVKQYQFASELTFLAIWALFVLVFFSVPESKIVGYILPVMPPLAILFAYTWCHYTSINKGRLMAKLLSLYAFIWILIEWVAVHYVVQQSFWMGSRYYALFLMAIVFVLFVPLVYALYKKLSFNFYFVYTAACMIVTFLILNNVMGFLYIGESTKSLATQIKQPLRPDTKVVTFYTFLPDLQIYINHPVYIANEWEQQAMGKNDTDMSRFAYQCAHHLRECPLLITPQMLKQWWQQYKPVYIVCPRTRLEQFKTQIGVYYVLAKTPDNVLIVNDKPKTY